MALHTQLEIYKVAYELLSFAIGLIRQMPRDVKQTVGHDIQVQLRQATVLIGLANGSQGRARAEHLQRLLAHVEAASLLLRVARDARWISVKAWARATQLIDSVTRQAGGWLKSAAPAA